MIGISFSDNSILFASVSGNASHGKLRKSLSIKLKKGIIDKGNIIQEKELVAILQKAKKKFGGSRVALCLPSSLAYCTNIPLEKKMISAKAINKLLVDTLPEEIEHMLIKKSVVTTSTKAKALAVIAIRHDTLSSYIHACKKAGYKATCITTASLGLSSMLKTKYPTMVTIKDTDTPITITLAHHSICIDEELLSTKSTHTNIVSAMQKLIDMYKEIHPTKIISIVGNGKFRKALEKSLTKEQMATRPAVYSSFEWMKEKDLPFVGACISCFSKGNHTNFLKSERTGKNIAAMLELFLALGICGITVSYFRPDLITLLLQWIEALTPLSV